MFIAAAGTALSGISSVIKTSAAGPNADAAKQTLPEALGGNLAAVQAFVSRSTIQTVSSAKPWQDGLAQIRSAHPDWLDLAKQAAASGRFPASWWQLSPPQVYPAVRAGAWSVADQNAAGGTHGDASGATPGGSSSTQADVLMQNARGARTSLWVIGGLVAVLGIGAVWYFKKGR